MTQIFARISDGFLRASNGFYGACNTGSAVLSRGSQYLKNTRVGQATSTVVSPIFAGIRYVIPPSLRNKSVLYGVVATLAVRQVLKYRNNTVVAHLNEASSIARASGNPALADRIQGVLNPRKE